MKLHLVADYDINGKMFATTHTIDSSNNLAGLPLLTTMQVPTTDGGFIPVAPKFLLMCKSGKKAEEVAEAWSEGYRKEGKLYDFKAVDAAALRKTAA